MGCSSSLVNFFSVWLRKVCLIVKYRKRIPRFPSPVPRCCARRDQDRHLWEQRVRVSVFCSSLVTVLERVSAFRNYSINQRMLCVTLTPSSCDVGLLMWRYALGSTRITDWRSPSPSKTRTFPKMEPRARFCLRKHLVTVLDPLMKYGLVASGLARACASRNTWM
jgi:hypothetical protein